MKSRRWATAGMVGAVAALTVLTAGTAGAVTPTSVTAGTPSWASSQLKAGGSFKNNATLTATYSYTLQLVRTSTATKPTCSTASGCPTGSTQVLLNGVTSSVSVAKSTSVTLPSLSVNCAASTTARYYWSWLKVADSSGNVVATSSSYIAGKYC